jgi:hypothetical protein
MMTATEAKDLLDKLTENATISRMGTVRITNEDHKTETIEAVYSVSDMIRLLDKGLSPKVVLSILNQTEC